MLLVFLLLVYVYPLHLMTQALVDLMLGRGATIVSAEKINLFALYGIGFAAMSACVAGLFGTSLRLAPPGARRAAMAGDCVIWSMLAASSLLSAAMTTVAPTWAQWLYALLPVAIGLFVWRHDRSGGSEVGMVDDAVPVEGA